MKLGRQEAVMLIIFGLVLGLAIYFFFSPANNNLVTENYVDPEYEEVIQVITDYNSYLNEYNEVHRLLISHGTSMISDNIITKSELIGYETDLKNYVGASSMLKKNINNAQDVVDKNEMFFQNATRVINDFKEVDDFVYTEMSAVIGFLNGITDITDDIEHKEILNNLSNQLVDIRND